MYVYTGIRKMSFNYQRKSAYQPTPSQISHWDQRKTKRAVIDYVYSMYGRIGCNDTNLGEMTNIYSKQKYLIELVVKAISKKEKNGGFETNITRDTLGVQILKNDDMVNSVQTVSLFDLEKLNTNHINCDFIITNNHS